MGNSSNGGLRLNRHVADEVGAGLELWLLEDAR